MATQPVVEPVKMPTIKKADNKFIAAVNAITISLACFFGWMTIFAAIASFTKKGWGIDIPLVGWLFGNNFGSFGGSVDIVLLSTGLLTVLFAVAGLISARKITDVEAMKCSWKKVRNVFVFITIVEIFKMIALAIYALCGLGKAAGVQQGYLWLNGFLSNVLAGLGAAAVAAIAHMIAAGKTQVLSIMRFVALGIAGAALIITVIATFVGFYNKPGLKSSGSSSSSSYDYDLNSLYDLFK
ncbi:hypothetical protein J6X09_00525 [Candidatus Saccharibacteria bacterium]|nr:hypothetical protein [Candidatus Saccharibacteria bacterium]